MSKTESIKTQDNTIKKKKRKRKVKVEDGFDAGDEAGAGSGGPGENGGVGGDQPGTHGFGEEEGRQKGEWKMKKLPKPQFNYKCFQKNSFKQVVSHSYWLKLPHFYHPGESIGQ